MPADHGNSHPTSREGRSSTRLAGVIVCAVLAICSAIVAGTAWTRPTLTPSTIPYSQVGQLSYSAPSSPTSIYGSRGLTTGQPIYGSTLSAVNVAYVYRFHSIVPASLRGTERLVATASNGQGITRTIALQAKATTFKGERFQATGVLDLVSLQSVASAFDQAAGAPGSVGTYPVTIGALVNVQGQLGSAALSASFDSPVAFTLSGANLIPGGSSTTAAAPGKVNFAPSASGSVTRPLGTAATLLPGLTVANAREGALGVLVVSLLLLGLAGWPLLREANSQDEGARIAARYGSTLVHTDAIETPAGVVVVRMDSFDGLLRVSRRLECPILHWGDGGHVYAVVDTGTLYRYRAEPSMGLELAPGPAGNGAARPGSELTGKAQRRVASERQAAVLLAAQERGHGA